MTTEKSWVFTVNQESANQRLDQFLAQQLPQFSRTLCQKFIEQGLVTINNTPITKYSFLVKEHDSVTVLGYTPTPLPASQPIPKGLVVDVLLEQEHFLALSKPPGLMTHAPSTVTSTFTLIDWLVAHFHEISSVGSPERPGIVHRLDKDTSGVMVIAKNNYGLMLLGDLFKKRLVHKTYLAIVHGNPPQEGVIAANIASHPVIKTKKIVSQKSGKEATTHYRVLEYFNDHALLELKPLTGRTHQLRVHCASIGHPIIGDTVYGKQSPLIKRQALHAHTLAFEFLGRQYTITAPLYEDMQTALEILRTTSK